MLTLFKNNRSITAAVFDAALNFRDAYMEYIPNYPIAAYRIDDEMANNAAFKVFVEVGTFSISPVTPMNTIPPIY